MNLQRHDLVAVELEDELKVDGTAGEIPGESVGNDGLRAFPGGRERLDRVLVFLPGLRLPLLDRYQASVRLAFVPHDGVFSKTLGKGFAVTSICGEIDGDGLWHMDSRFGSWLRHMHHCAFV